jgi:hypothetical protein
MKSNETENEIKSLEKEAMRRETAGRQELVERYTGEALEERYLTAA